MNALLLVIVNLIWAAQPTVVKLIPADRLGPFAIAFVPFFLVTPLLAPLLWRGRGTAAAFRPTAADWGRFAIAGIGGQIVAQLGMTWGSVIGQASSCVILYLLIPVLTAVLASAMLGEPITRLRIACLAIGLAGVLLMSAKDLVGVDLIDRRYLFGNLLFLVGCIGASFYNVYCKRLMGRFSDQDTLVASYLTVLPASVPLLAWMEPGCLAGLAALDARGWGALLFLAILVYGLSMLMFFHVLERLPATVVLASTYLVPVFGVAIAFFLLGERLDATTLAGAAIVLAATVLVMRLDSAPPALPVIPKEHP